MRYDEVFEGNEKKSFFRDEEQRNLWIKLNAERIRYSQKILNNRDINDLGDIDTPYTHLWVSNNQLVYDEHQRDQPRFSLEELAAMSQEDLLRLSEERNKEIIKEIFDETFNQDDDDFIVLGGDEDFL